MPKIEGVKKVLVLGSGAIRIGQAGEFDYSGSQCLKAIREEGIETVLVNPNIATIQTDPKLAGKVYLLPVIPEFVIKVIEKERPDGILLAFGGQTALNCGVNLSKMGVFEKYNIKVLGTPVEAIEATEDRELFRQAMFKVNVGIAKSKVTSSIDEAIKIAEGIGYPILLRPAYVLGGKGASVAYNEEDLITKVRRGLTQSMINQVLVEQFLEPQFWKEIEFEVVRDADNNCICTCSMENFDPVGIHTGDSIVVAPVQTLTLEEFETLREASIKIIRSLGIVGECNIQFALHNRTGEFKSIEVNARLSRSSALASKATGYPLAYIAAKLALGYTLPELKNLITLNTMACFEPATDYIVAKVPRWDLQKFKNVSRHVGPQMKSVGEVMSIGRNVEEILQKAVRMLDIGKIGLVCNPEDDEPESLESLKDQLANPTDQRLYKIPKAIKAGLTVDQIHQLSGIDKFFIYKIRHIVEIEKELKRINIILIEPEKLRKIIKKAKVYGFSDLQIAKCLNTDELTIRRLRKKHNIIPCVKQIDTYGGEWPAKRNYLYLTYAGSYDDVQFETEDKKIIVLGSGCYRIGSSVEFDWGSVQLVWALKNEGIKEVIMINYNPETVSTDYDMSDKLYFEEITFERVLDIYEKENPYGIVVSVGGQVSNNIAPKLASLRDYFRTGKVNVIGTMGRNIDRAEDRSKFSNLLDNIGIKQPQWNALTTIDKAKEFANDVGYPVLVRPSYVLSGAAMRVAYSEDQLEEFLLLAANVSQEYPVVITKYFENARELEVDAVSDGTDTFIGSVVEHVENAGVHSGDASMVIPPQTVPEEIVKTIEDYTQKIAVALNIIGPFNVQYLVKNNTVYVIETNLRSSRSMPYVSKTRGINLMILAAAVMLGKKLKDLGVLEHPYESNIGVKVPMFSFMRLSGADPVLGVEMVSTGEIATYGETFEEALLKSLLAAELDIPRKNGHVLITVGGKELKNQIVPIAKKFQDLGFTIYATEHTAEALTSNGIHTTVLFKMSEVYKHPNIKDYLLSKKIDLVINIPMTGSIDKYVQVMEDEYNIRRQAVEHNVLVITNLEFAKAFVESLEKVKEFSIYSLNDLMDRLKFKVGW